MTMTLTHSTPIYSTYVGRCREHEAGLPVRPEDAGVPVDEAQLLKVPITHAHQGLRRCTCANVFASFIILSINAV